MSQIKLFKAGAEGVEEIKVNTPVYDPNLIPLIEKDSKKIFGVTYLASNYHIGKGTLSLIGLDENRIPVVFVYSNESNFISKGLFGIEQILDNKEKFISIVNSKLRKKASESIDFSNPRIIAVATGFNKYDRAAVSQLSRSFSLIQYSLYEDDIYMFELVEANAGTPIFDENLKLKNSWETSYKKAKPYTKALFDRLCEYVAYFDSTVTINYYSSYVAFKKIKNFACTRVDDKGIHLFLNLEPQKYVALYPDYVKDATFLTKIGNGQLEITINSEEQYEVAKKLLLDAYNKN